MRIYITDDEADTLKQALDYVVERMDAALNVTGDQNYRFGMKFARRKIMTLRGKLFPASTPKDKTP